jgi:hypothetical protein
LTQFLISGATARVGLNLGRAPQSLDDLQGISGIGAK